MSLFPRDVTWRFRQIPETSLHPNLSFVFLFPQRKFETVSTGYCVQPSSSGCGQAGRPVFTHNLPTTRTYIHRSLPLHSSPFIPGTNVQLSFLLCLLLLDICLLSVIQRWTRWPHKYRTRALSTYRGEEVSCVLLKETAIN